MGFVFRYTTTTLRCRLLTRWISHKSTSSKLSPSNTWPTFKTPPHTLPTTTKNLYTRTNTHNMSSYEWASSDPLSSQVAKVNPVPNKDKPENLANTLDDKIPIIDMSNKNKDDLVRQLTNACEDHGIFKLINHGIPLELCNNVLDVVTQLFEFPHEEKAAILATEHMEVGKFYRYYIKNEDQEKIYVWGEAFYHNWYPDLDNSEFNKQSPVFSPSYREVIPQYCGKIAPLTTRLLSLLSQGLGLNEVYLQKKFGENPWRNAQANYYPACPEPDVTLGLRDHTDIQCLSIVLQDDSEVKGLQIRKDDGKWYWVAPGPPGALVVNVADQLQVLSNDRFKSAIHRAVNNETKDRPSFALFMGPQLEDMVGPIPELINDNNPALYRNYELKEFMEEFKKLEGYSRTKVKDMFKFKKR